MSTCVSRRLALISALALAYAPIDTEAAEVNGIFTEPATKDLGELTGNDFFKNWKIRGWIEGYLEWNGNSPSEATVNANQPSSIVKGSALSTGGNVSIEGRTFDIHDHALIMTLSEIELEKVPQLSNWLDPTAFGFKVDVDYGDTPDIIKNTILGALPPDALRNVDRLLQAYSISYVAPLGRGLRMDFGKLVTHIGGETIESIKNNNFSHGFLYSYAIPFQDTGFRFNYPVTDTFYTEFYVLQGWNVTWHDNNKGKTFGPSFGWTPTPRVSMYLNYLWGPEQNNSSSNDRQLVDFGINFNPVDPLNIFVYGDYGYEQNAITTSSGEKTNTYWVGAASVFRYKLTDQFEPALRVEYYKDPDGFTTGVDQTLVGTTLTLNYRFDLPYGAHLLLRPELRWDHSSNHFFTDGNNFRVDNNQFTGGAGVVLYY